MAFAYTTNNDGIPNFVGDRKIVTGTFTNGGADTGGDIETGLSVVEHFQIQHTGSAVVASAAVVNESLPLQSGTVTIVTVADADGTWIAYGY